MAGNLRDQAYNIAVNNAEEQLIDATRSFEDSERHGDATGMAYAYEGLKQAQANLDRLTGADEPQQQRQNGELSPAQQRFLQRRQALGDDMSPARFQDYARAALRATAAGWQEDSPQWFAAIEGAVDSQGDGRQAQLNERSAAEISGISPEEYAQGAARLQQMKRQGYYRD